MPVVRTDGRSGGRCTVTWLPNFLGWIDFLKLWGFELSPWSNKISAQNFKHYVTSVDRKMSPQIHSGNDGQRILYFDSFQLTFIRKANIRINRLRVWVRHIRPACGYAVSNFDLLLELWENTQIQISFKHYSFIVIIICFFFYKLIIGSTFCMNLMWCIFEGTVVSQWSIFHFVFFIWSWVSS